MKNNIFESDLARYVNAGHDLAELVAEAIRDENWEGMQKQIVLALNEFAASAQAVSTVVETLQVANLKLN